MAEWAIWLAPLSVRKWSCVLGLVAGLMQFLHRLHLPYVGVYDLWGGEVTVGVGGGVCAAGQLVFVQICLLRMFRVAWGKGAAVRDQSAYMHGVWECVGFCRWRPAILNNWAAGL